MPPKITPRKSESTIVVKTMPDKIKSGPSDWWNANSKSEMANKLMATVSFLKEQNQYRYRQATLYARMYGNFPLMGSAGNNFTKINNKSTLPPDRPTMSVVTSCIDTIVSRLSQNNPRPIFLTDNGDYKKRTLAKQLNQFISGEFYHTDAYRLGKLCLRDASVWGTGVIKVLEGQDKRVRLERRLPVQLMVDANDAFMGEPRQMYELSLVDRHMLAAMFPKYRSMIAQAEQAYPEVASSDKTISDQVMIAEAWRLPSSPDAGDGLHTIACSEGTLDDELWDKDYFPFAFLNYCDPLAGFWGQGIAERQMGTQSGINQLLMTIHKSINLVGVPRVFVEDGSKVVKAQINNDVGAIVTYRGTKPSYEVAPCVPVELYQQLERLVRYAYEQEGISQLSATSQKPAGLNSGEAIRAYDDTQSDRFSYIQKKYDGLYIDLAYLMTDKAKDIATRDGSYSTIYPDKDGTREIDLPAAKLDKDPVIQCYDMSSLPKEPAGRLARVTEMMQAGIISQQEGRRLLAFPDIEQEDKLSSAAEERILKTLDDIVEDGKYTPPDPFTDIALAEKIVVQYINLYLAANLEEKKAQLLRNYFSQVQALKLKATQPPSPGIGPDGQPLANPMAPPTSDLLPNVPGNPGQGGMGGIPG